MYAPEQHLLEVWDLANGQKLTAIPVAAPPVAAGVSSDGSHVTFPDPTDANVIMAQRLTGAREGPRVLFSTGSGPAVMTGLYSDQKHAFRCGAALVAAGGSEGRSATLRIIDIETGRLISTHRDAVQPVWSPDGRLLATVARETSGKVQATLEFANGVEARVGSVKVWQVFRGAPIYYVSDRIESLEFSPTDSELTGNGIVWNVVSKSGGSRSLVLASEENRAEFATYDSSGQLRTAAFPDKAPPQPLRLVQQPQLHQVELDHLDYSDLRPPERGGQIVREVHL